MQTARTRPHEPNYTNHVTRIIVRKSVERDRIPDKPTISRNCDHHEIFRMARADSSPHTSIANDVPITMSQRVNYDFARRASCGRGCGCDSEICRSPSRIAENHRSKWRAGNETNAIRWTNKELMHQAMPRQIVDHVGCEEARKYSVTIQWPAINRNQPQGLCQQESRITRVRFSSLQNEAHMPRKYSRSRPMIAGYRRRTCGTSAGS